MNIFPRQFEKYLNIYVCLAFRSRIDSLNVASRMMSSAEFGSIQLSDSTYHLVRDRGYRVEEKTVQVKGLGAMSTFIVLDRVTGLSIDISPFLAKPTRK